MIDFMQIINEANAGVRKFGKYNTPHEGYAILLEEVDELWDVVKSKGGTPEQMVEEAIQIAACAYQFAIQADEWDWANIQAER